jgi:hypothetical protein
LAVANYRSAYGSLPPAYIADSSGRPMHSWRVLLLPFLGQSELYNAYNFAEPWDGPHNRLLEDRIGQVYRRSGLGAAEVRTTSFVAEVGPGTAWPGARAVRDEEVGDGLDKTLLVVEVPEGRFRWMEPKDLDFDSMSFRINGRSGRGLGSRLGGARVVTVGDSVRTLPDQFDQARLRALLTANGRDPVELP